MKCEILKDFPCATDASGVKAVDLKAGTTHDVLDDLVPGLEVAGYVKRNSDQNPLPLNEPEPHPLDHDGDGRKGGNRPKRRGA